MLCKTLFFQSGKNKNLFFTAGKNRILIVTAPWKFVEAGFYVPYYRCSADIVVYKLRSWSI